MYRLLADILNDTAFILDCLSPVLPKALRIVVLSFSSVLRALCGVAAGSAKASLSAHFAKWGNLGELNAKDSSQETVISLLGMLVGTLVVSWVTTPIATWTTLILLLSIHLETNRRAVRAVTMRTLNRQRATIVFNRLFGYRDRPVPTPEDVAKAERIFERDGVLRSVGGDAIGHCIIGSSFLCFLHLISSPHATTKSTNIKKDLLPRIQSFYKDQQYMLWYSVSDRWMRVEIVVKKSATSKDLLLAWWHALQLANVVIVAGWQQIPEKWQEDPDDWALTMFLEHSLKHVKAIFERYEVELREAGWDLDSGALETRSSTRISIEA